MIDLYTWTTPNGRKVAIMLEELGLEYRARAVDIENGEQFSPEFAAISPNNKIPAIVDHDTGAHLMESGAILLYLAERTGRFMPASDAGRYSTWEWLMWQMGGIGPFLGQAHHFLKFNPGKAPYAEVRYANEARRLYSVLDRRLEGRDYMVDEYTIADIATWPWIARHPWQRIDLNDFPNVRRWYLALASRPAVVRGFHVPSDSGPIPMPE